MQALAEVDPDFRRLHQFFARCVDLDKEQFLVHCRTHMPAVGETIANRIGASQLTTALTLAPISSDEEVVALSARLMEQMIKTVEKLK
jgi:hypothetical protein